ncbi:MAG: pitrilysin family protein [Chloroflexi bacterium]|nr:pitrilysin family protein [Chloroflexota bacterium]MDA1145990.1 pitrilysin family protein [Chloroflexota bacterium]
MTSSPDAPQIGGLAPFSLPAVERTVLASGVSVALAASGSIPKAYLRLVLGFGTGTERSDETWLTRLIGDYLTQGAGELDTAGLADAVAQMGGRLDVSVDEDTTTLSTSVLSEFAPDAVRLLATVAREPRFPESELARLRADLGRRLELAKSQPGTLAASAFRRAVYGDHAYGRLLASPEQIAGFTTEAVRATYEAHAGASASRLYVAGLFDSAAVLAAADGAFDGWSNASGRSSEVPQPRSERAIYLVDRPGAEQSTLQIGLPVPPPSADDYVALSVTNSLLGGSFYSRITLNIRENKGYTYSPRSQMVAHPSDAFWVEQADVTTNVTGASLHEIFKEIELLRAEPAGEQELADIQNYVAGSYVLRHATPGGVLEQLAFLDLHGLDEGWAAAYAERVLALTTADVQRIAVEHLRPDEMTIAIVGDRRAIAEEIAPYGAILEAAPA